MVLRPSVALDPRDGSLRDVQPLPKGHKRPNYRDIKWFLLRGKYQLTSTIGNMSRDVDQKSIGNINNMCATSCAILYDALPNMGVS